LEALDQLVHPDTRGNPMSLLKWTSKSTAKLASELVRRGFTISDDTVGRLLKRLGYSLLSPAKVKEGTAHPDRDGRFKYLHGLAAEFVTAGDPVISVDTKKKEMVGEYANGGVEWQPAGQPVRVNVHDFVDPELGRGTASDGTSPARAFAQPLANTFLIASSADAAGRQYRGPANGFAGSA
jgi:hypothetical protein